MFSLVLEKAEKSEIKLPTYAESLKKQESSRKASTSALLTMPKPLTVWIAGVQLQQPGNLPEGMSGVYGNDVASDLRYRTTCLFQASGSLLYFFKSIRSEV